MPKCDNCGERVARGELAPCLCRNPNCPCPNVCPDCVVAIRANLARYATPVFAAQVAQVVASHLAKEQTP